MLTTVLLRSAQTVAATEGLPQCSACSAGEYQDERGQSACKPCPKGHWCTNERAEPCSANTYNPLPNAFDQTNCTRCPERTTTLERTAPDSIEDCVCSEGLYLPSDNRTMASEHCTGRCCVCPVGALCTAPAISLVTLPLRPGYYRPSRESIDVRRCPDVSVPLERCITTIAKIIHDCDKKVLPLRAGYRRLLQITD